MVRRTRLTTALLATVLTATLAACGGEPAPEPSPSAATKAPAKATLVFGVSGHKKLVDTYKQLAAEYTRAVPNVTVEVKSWPTEDQLTAAMKSGEKVDVVLTPRADVAGFAEDKRIQPVDTLLEARNVDFGDKYSREAMEDFSVDRRLECMPYSVSPQVVYVNTGLVDLAGMKEAGVPTPSARADGSLRNWTLEQFSSTMTYAGEHKKGVRGTYVEQNLSALMPWLAGAGATLFDDPLTPTSTALGDSAGAYEDLVEAFSQPNVLATNKDLGKRTPFQAFKQGRLVALAGDRSLVSDLRATEGIEWDVMPMPGGNGTTGEYAGLCMGSKTADADTAADFLAYLISTESVVKMVRTGHFVPVNSEVGYAPVFTQPERNPKNARIFTDTVRDMQVLPEASQITQLQKIAAQAVRGSMTVAEPDQIEDFAVQIDELSKTVFPQPTPSSSPSTSPSGSPSPSA
ncbi:multiple sugar transport system substrate-binding protein [Nocardioides albertanoniae]|uniref:Multiple sugar transport system substrate-binding protein n=1 Tax=Nocardioides albertanoniae TaxID=1175486 RepID=A0A543A3N2_9ACTN|nr:extracellular solute-binding protein [Nocardioides albertanoniae]TQL67174.1 multiple sugar transport system substrate-binding protein [Nocardioides albertanoniae]